MAPPVVAVVVAAGSSEHLGDVLSSLAAQTYSDLDVIVVTLDGADIPEGAPGVRIVLQGRPGSNYSDAVRFGLDNAGGIKAAYLLLLHDDVSLERDSVEKMVARATEPGVAAVGAKLVEWDDPSVLQEVGSGLDRFAVRRSHLDAGEIDVGQRDDTSEVLFASDACLLVRADAYAEIGGLDPHAWPLYEDVDLCWRLRASGRSVVVATDTRVRHASMLSRERRGLDTVALSRALERGRLRFVLKHFSRFGVAAVLPQLVVAALVRMIGAAFTRDFWKIRATVGAWTSVLRELPGLRRGRRASPPVVDDRELLAIGARSAVAERRHERAESLARALAAREGLTGRVQLLLREPVAWGCFVAAIVVALILRTILFGGTFVLGELRALPTFGGAMSALFARVRPEGLDPFAPGTPGLVVLGVLRTVALQTSLGEKLALFLPLAAAGLAGARFGRVLELGPRGRGWIGVGAAANPVTFALLADGRAGALVAWAGSLWLVGSLLAPSTEQPANGEARTERIRFYARWAIAWAVVVALHPPALIWFVALGMAVTAARRGDGLTTQRLRAMGAGVAGALVLLAPWSLEWFTARSPLVGRPGWLVVTGWSGIGSATLGAGATLVGWLIVAYAGAFLVGITRTTLALAALGGGALLLGAGGAMPSDSMLVAVGACALVMVALAARSIADELPRYELGLRHGLVIAGVAALAAMWFLTAIVHVAGGARTRSVPLLAANVKDSGRVLWLSSTTGGVRSWTTAAFDPKLGAFPPPAGPAERLAAGALEAARTNRTHRAGSILALADISHIVALDPDAGRGLESQADIAQAETHDRVVLYRNESWLGPVVQLAAPPRSPLAPKGLAAAVRAGVRLPVNGWPRGPIAFSVPTDRTGVVYIAGGLRRGWHIDAAKGRLAAAGEYVPASRLHGDIRAKPPRGWRFLLPLEVLAALGVLAAWGAAAYLSRPAPARRTPRGTEPVLQVTRPLIALPVIALLAGFLIGWTGVAARAGGAFLSQAWYCPPIGSGFGQWIAVANPSHASTEVLVRPSLHAAPAIRSFVPARSRVTFEVPSEQGGVVEAFGHRLAVAVQVRRGGNLDASLCSPKARELNLFPEGGRAATMAVPRLFERYVIYNPYADVARASVRFLSPKEMIAPPALQDVQVKPGSFIVVNPEQEFEPMLDLSTIIRVWQGRAIVARRLTTVEQLSWSLGADLQTYGVFPRAVTQDALTKIIAVNPTDNAVRISASGHAEDSTVPQQNLDVDPNSRTSIDLNSFAPQANGLVIDVHADHPVAMEALVVPKGRRKRLSLLPPLQPARSWVLPIGEARRLVLTNPNTGEAKVSLVRLGPGPDLGTVTVPADHMLPVDLPGDGQFAVLIEANRPVTAMAFGDGGALDAVPL